MRSPSEVDVYFGTGLGGLFHGTLILSSGIENLYSEDIDGDGEAEVVIVPNHLIWSWGGVAQASISVLNDYVEGERLSATTFSIPATTSTTLDFMDVNRNGISAVVGRSHSGLFLLEGKQPNVRSCDFDQNGTCDVGDLDALLYEGIATQDLVFDLDKSGAIDLQDRDAFLSEIDSLPGDLSFDGKTGVEDLNVLAKNWQQDAHSYADGDLNGDSRIDAADLNLIGQWWQRESKLKSKRQLVSRRSLARVDGARSQGRIPTALARDELRFDVDPTLESILAVHPSWRAK